METFQHQTGMQCCASPRYQVFCSFLLRIKNCCHCEWFTFSDDIKTLDVLMCLAAWDFCLSRRTTQGLAVMLPDPTWGHVSYCAAKYVCRLLNCPKKKGTKKVTTYNVARHTQLNSGKNPKNKYFFFAQQWEERRSWKQNKTKIPDNNLCVRLSLWLCLVSHPPLLKGLWWMMFFLIRSHFSHWLIIHW